jgi:peptidoglycan/xylan/chitin deacetylase (PgdA/CDA1 family)
LEILKENDATATFFVIGNQVPGNEEILADIVRAGHELGNHAMHDEPSVSLSSDVLAQEINQVDTIINQAYEQGGRVRSSHHFRPGSGVFSQRILAIAEKAGYQAILGSIYPHDPFISRWRVNAWHVLSSLRPGAVIICHDRRSWTVPMLRKALPGMKQKGFEVASVSGLLSLLNEQRS